MSNNFDKRYWVFRELNRSAEKISVDAFDALDAVEYGMDHWNRKKGIWAEEMTQSELVQWHKDREFTT